MYALLIGLPVLVAAARGVLTDRYGVQVMFVAVSLASTAPVLAMGLADSLPAVIVAGAATGRQVCGG